MTTRPALRLHIAWPRVGRQSWLGAELGVTTLKGHGVTNHDTESTWRHESRHGADTASRITTRRAHGVTNHDTEHTASRVTTLRRHGVTNHDTETTRRHESQH